jgi:uncharacterized protein (DUF4415 family)
LKKLDAHVIQPEEYEDAPELTDEQLAQADLYEGEKLIRRGRPPSPNRKEPVKLRLDPDVVAALRASGPGWQTRINAILRKAMFKAKTPAEFARIRKLKKTIAKERQVNTKKRA